VLTKWRDFSFNPLFNIRNTHQCFYFVVLIPERPEGPLWPYVPVFHVLGQYGDRIRVSSLQETCTLRNCASNVVFHFSKYIAKCCHQKRIHKMAYNFLTIRTLRHNGSCFTIGVVLQISCWIFFLSTPYTIVSQPSIPIYQSWMAQFFIIKKSVVEDSAPFKSTHVARNLRTVAENDLSEICA